MNLAIDIHRNNQRGSNKKYDYEITKIIKSTRNV